MKRIRTFAGATVFTAILAAQRPPDDTIYDNMGQLEVTVTMDRQEYFDGEASAATVKIKNPTAGPLVVADPFHREVSAMEIYRLLDSNAVEPVVTRDAALPRDEVLAPDTPLTTFTAGEERIRTFRAAKGGELWWPRDPGWIGVPPGAYRLTFTYWKSDSVTYWKSDSVRFRVVNPILEQVARVRLRTDELVVDAVPQYRAPLYRYVIAVRRGTESYICVSNRSIWQIRGRESPLGEPLERGGYYGPFQRIATVGPSITELSATLGALDSIDITWRDAVGGAGRATVDLNTLQVR